MGHFVVPGDAGCVVRGNLGRVWLSLANGFGSGKMRGVKITGKIQICTAVLMEAQALVRALDLKPAGPNCWERGFDLAGELGNPGASAQGGGGKLDGT